MSARIWQSIVAILYNVTVNFCLNPLHDGVGPQSEQSERSQISVFTIRIDKAGRIRAKDPLPGEPRARAMPDGCNPNRFFAIEPENRNLRIYRRYKGGPYWRPTIPDEMGMRDTTSRLLIEEVTPSGFVQRLPKMQFMNHDEMRWAPTSVEIDSYDIENSAVILNVNQFPGIEGFEHVKIRTLLRDGFGEFNGKPRIGLILNDFFGKSRELSVCHDGHAHPTLGIRDGREFRTVRSIFFDGLRLRLTYRKYRGINTATMYLEDPSNLYKVGLSGISGTNKLGMPNILETEVKLLRNLEQGMLLRGSSYDHGRLGAEIAYSISKQLLGIESMTIAEPSRGGRDLFSTDQQTAIQARLIVDFTQFRPLTKKEAIDNQMKQLLSKIGQDFRWNRLMTTGYAILSYFDSREKVSAVVAERKKNPVTS